MQPKLFYKNFFVVQGIDIILLICSLSAAYLVRFDFDLPQEFLLLFFQMLPFILIIKLIVFYYFDLYRGMWRYTSVSDLINIIKAASVSSLIIISFILFGTSRFIGFSRSIFLIDWCFTILLISTFRLSVRFYFEQAGEGNSWLVISRTFTKLLNRSRTGSINLLIIGAGDCGEKIYREIRDNAHLRYNVIGFLDDKPVKIGKKIHGIPILSDIADIKAVASNVKADEALIAIPSATSDEMRKIVEHCKESGIKFKTVPSYGELINGKVTVNAIREVAYRDLLGREVIELDETRIGDYLHGQTVLVTGAGGSIGSELCRQICRFGPSEIVLYERAESPLYEIELELLRNYHNVKIVPLLGDIQNKKQLARAFSSFNPNTIFHAAAYKHVPMLELQPWKAIENNILGTINVIETAKAYNIERFVFVSTDKAVRPANVMGTSKRVAEMLVQSQNSCNPLNTRFMIVRFGNVVGSVGSVVPLFKKQIEKGGPVTVTHPEVTRYFMTIPEACQLILQAGAMGKGGEIFVLDMGTPIKIDDMARDLIRLSGFVPNEDIKIEYIGLRPGEKLYEELITEGEGIVPSDHEKIMVIRGVECELNIFNGLIQTLEKLAEDQDKDRIIATLKKIVPEYQTPGNCK
jgi:FlaA1/EpsC-like NDP-sugar epimerase